MRLSKVRIRYGAVVCKKKATLLGTFIIQTSIQGNEELVVLMLKTYTSWVTRPVVEMEGRPDLQHRKGADWRAPVWNPMPNLGSLKELRGKANKM